MNVDCISNKITLLRSLDQLLLQKLYQGSRIDNLALFNLNSVPYQYVRLFKLLDQVTIKLVLITEVRDYIFRVEVSFKECRIFFIQPDNLFANSSIALF